jgi:hypothetical protein
VCTPYCAIVGFEDDYRDLSAKTSQDVELSAYGDIPCQVAITWTHHIEKQNIGKVGSVEHASPQRHVHFVRAALRSEHDEALIISCNFLHTVGCYVVVSGPV